jgi:hypothetical protein
MRDRTFAWEMRREEREERDEHYLGPIQDILHVPSPRMIPPTFPSSLRAN